MKHLYSFTFAKAITCCIELLLIAPGGRMAAQQQPEIPPPGQAISMDQINDLEN